MRHFTLIALLSLWSTAAFPCGAQQHRRVKARRPVGCWNVEPGPFSVVGTTRVDSGQTVLPSVVQFDTVPGKTWFGEPIGRLVRAVVVDNGTRYRDGYYVVSRVDSLKVEWTDGDVGMTFLMRLDSLVMHGRASAWTDYLGKEQASIVLRRTACPSAR